MSDQILTVQEAADRLKLKPAGVRRLIRTGALPAAKIGHSRPGYRIFDSEIERFIAESGASREGVPS